MNEDDENFLNNLREKNKYKSLLEVLHNALLEDRNNMMVWVETKDKQYEVEDVKFEQFVDQNRSVCTVITIKV